MRAAAVIVLCVGLATTAVVAQTKFVDGLRGPTPLAEESTPPPLANPGNNDVRRDRAYAMQPPTIPHKIDGYQLDHNVNACLECHRRTRTAQTQAVPVSVTHYMDRDGNFLAEVSPRRYFCVQCHVTQVDAKPRVANTYEDVEEIVRRQAASAAQRKASGK